jgi:anti-sigma B factor antagonist
MADQSAHRAQATPPPYRAETSTPWPPAPVFSVKAVYSADEVRILLCGELDIAARPQLEGLLGGLAFESLSRVVVVDLRPLEFIDSTGIGFLLDLAKAARAHNTNLVCVRGPLPIQRVLAVAGIDHALTFIDEPGWC